MAPVRVVVVEDEPLFRELVAGALEEQPDVEVLAVFDRGEPALARAPALRPDVALLDIELGHGHNGVEVGLVLRERLPDVGIVLLSAHKDPSVLSALPKDQARGWSYLLKTSVSDVEMLARAVTGAAQGLVTIDPELTRHRGARPGGRLDLLTARQREILQLLAEGLSNAAIAQRLFIAQKSVENHINALFAQLGLDSGDRSSAPRVQAARIYLAETTAGR